MKGGEAAAAAGGGGAGGGGQGASGCSHGLDKQSTEKLLSTRVVKQDREERQVRRQGGKPACDCAADEYLDWAIFLKEP